GLPDGLRDSPLRGRLQQEIPDGDRLSGDRDEFFGSRESSDEFSDDELSDERFVAEGVDPRRPVNRNFQPPGQFQPGDLGPELEGVGFTAELTGEVLQRYGQALGRLSDRDFYHILNRLPPVPLRRAWRLLERVRAYWRDRALRSFTGNPDFALTREQKQELFGP